MKKLLITCKIDHTFSFSDAQKIFKAHPLFASDPQLSKTDPIDILITFEDFVLSLDSQFRQSRNSRIVESRRKERQVRDGFRDLLKENYKTGKVFFKSKWKDLYPQIKNDRRFLDMLGNPGSNPLELFWDYLILIEDIYIDTKRSITTLLRVKAFLLFSVQIILLNLLRHLKVFRSNLEKSYFRLICQQ
jgi:hypothetical protein